MEKTQEEVVSSLGSRCVQSASAPGFQGCTSETLPDGLSECLLPLPFPASFVIT